MEDLKKSLIKYNEQLCMVCEALTTAKDDDERQSLVALESELQQLIQLTVDSFVNYSPAELAAASSSRKVEGQKKEQNKLDDEYALFMKEMSECGAHEGDSTSKQDKAGSSKDDSVQKDEDSDIEDELASLIGIKCAVYYTPSWGGHPTLHNAMVSAVEPRRDDDQFDDLQVRLLYMHPTHAEMLPCPFYLDGECKFDEEKCRYSHGSLVQLSYLKDPMEPDFSSVRVGSKVLIKIKPPDGEDISLTRKATEKYHLWHRAIVRSVDVAHRTWIVKLEHGIQTGEKRKSTSDEYSVQLEDIFPLNIEHDEDSDSDNVSDTEYPANKSVRQEETTGNEHGRALLIEQSLQNNAPAMGEWERHTRGIGSKLMLAMGYVPGTGLGAASEGRLCPVEARVLPVGKSLDHCMAISDKAAAQDPLKMEQKLKRIQKREEERNKRAYERQIEKERSNVFNFLNRTLGPKPDEPEASNASLNVKQSTSTDLNIEQFKITEDTKKIQREIVKLNTSLPKYQPGTPGHMSIKMQISERNKELNQLRSKEREITKEQNHRENKKKMTVF